MNWQKIYSTIRSTMIMGGALIGAGGLYAVVVVGICRLLFKLEDNTALWIGGVVFVVFLIWGGIYLPKHFRKIGLIE